MSLSDNKLAIRRAFDRAAKHYETQSAIQRLAGDSLWLRVRGRPALRVLDGGCGTGCYSREWHHFGSHVTGLDLSEQMLKTARQTLVGPDYIQGDLEAIPLRSESVDLAWSNFALQWCADLPLALSELYRVTRPGGCVAFSLVGAGSLPELVHAWQAVDQRNSVNPFVTRASLNAICAPWRTVLQEDVVTQYFPNVMAALHSLKGVGASHLTHGRRGGLTTRHQLEKLMAVWPKQKEGYPLTWHILSGVTEREI